jgi:hypothetical protein
MRFDKQPKPAALLARDDWMQELHEALTSQCAGTLSKMRRNPKLLESLWEYKGANFTILNQYLRKNSPKPPNKYVQQADENLQEIISQQKWQFDDVFLFRAVQGAYGKRLLKLNVGDEFREPSYISTAYNHQHALGFGNVMLVIKMRKGMPFVYTDGFRDMYCKHHKKEVWAFLSEVVLNKGTVFKITAKEEKPRLHSTARVGVNPCAEQGMIHDRFHVLHVTVQPS